MSGRGSGQWWAVAGMAALLLRATPAGAGVPTDCGAFGVGAMRAYTLRDASDALPNDGKVFGIGVGPQAVAGVLADAGAPSDKITLSVDVLLVRAPGRWLLFDTGLGPKAQGALPASLAARHVAPGAITDVFLTHSHGDHVGGLLLEGRSAFPHAVIHMTAREWASMQGEPANAPIVAAIGPQVRTFAPGGQVVPGVTSIDLAGHTPGHVGYRIGTGAGGILDIGDLAHSAIVSLARPDWAIQFDADQPVGATLRRVMLARLAASGQRVFAPHFPYPGVGRIVAAGQGYAWRPETRCS